MGVETTGEIAGVSGYLLESWGDSVHPAVMGQKQKTELFLEGSGKAQSSI